MSRPLRASRLSDTPIASGLACLACLACVALASTACGSKSSSHTTTSSGAGAANASSTASSGSTSNGMTGGSGVGGEGTGGVGGSTTSGFTANASTTSSSGSGTATTATSGSSSTSSSGSSSSGSTNGNPLGKTCTSGIPSEGAPVDTSKPTSVVGTGTAASCTFTALQAAVTKGGIITFDCGAAPVTIKVTSTLLPPTTNEYAGDKPTSIVIDGGNKVTLDGGKAVQIFSWVHAGSWQVNQDTFTLQHIAIANGKATPTQAIPACPASGTISNTACSTGYDDGMGGALNMRDGNLRIIDCNFSNNEAALLGPDTGGGAIYVLGTKNPIYIVSSTFQGNKASNGGAVGLLWSGATIVDSYFESNSAVGTGANNNDPTMCTCMNNGQNEVGSGGNGGAIYKDGGDGATLSICGTEIADSAANEFGSAVFLTADGSNAKLVLQDSMLKANTSPIAYWNWCLGVSTDNPHASGSTTCSPSPVNTSFCDASNKCSTTCSS